MKDDQNKFLALLGQAPVRIHTEQVAWILNCQPYDVPILVSARVLKPLGNPKPNSVKYFATADILELAKESTWLAKVTNTLSQFWYMKNLRKKGHFPGERPDDGL